MSVKFFEMIENIFRSQRRFTQPRLLLSFAERSAFANGKSKQRIDKNLANVAFKQNTKKKN
jgi:hypothetical protein